MDNPLKLGAPWDEVKEKLKENDLTLSDEDLDYAPGREQELLERLSRKSNKTPEEIKEYIESIAANAAKAG